MTLEKARALVARQARAWERGDLTAIVADFAPDGVLISPGGRWQGREAVGAAAAAFFAVSAVVQIVVTRVILDGDEGAVEWTWSEMRRSDGHQHTVEDAIIFALRDDKIIYWREYVDTATIWP